MRELGNDSSAGPRPHRRDVLKIYGAGAVGVALGSVDDSALAATKNSFPMPCAPEAWTKHGVVIPPTEPWELNEIQNFNSNTETLPDGRWRIWYGVNHMDPGSMNIVIGEGKIGEPFKKTRAMLTEGDPEDAPLAIGNLPAGWRASAARPHSHEERQASALFLGSRSQGWRSALHRCRQRRWTTLPRGECAQSMSDHVLRSRSSRYRPGEGHALGTARKFAEAPIKARRRATRVRRSNHERRRNGLSACRRIIRNVRAVARVDSRRRSALDGSRQLAWPHPRDRPVR